MPLKHSTGAIALHSENENAKRRRCVGEWIGSNGRDSVWSLRRRTIRYIVVVVVMVSFFILLPFLVLCVLYYHWTSDPVPQSLKLLFSRDTGRPWIGIVLIIGVAFVTIVCGVVVYFLCLKGRMQKKEQAPAAPHVQDVPSPPTVFEQSSPVGSPPVGPRRRDPPLRSPLSKSFTADNVV